MRICVPSDGDEGVEAALNPHFGSAPWFTVVDTDTGDVEVIANPNRFHVQGQCHPVGALAGARVDTAVVSGIGARALARLAESGVRVYLTKASTVLDALVEVRAGALEEIDPASACAGRGEHGVHHHHAH